MGFNLEKLNAISPKHRERSIDVPELSAFFGDGESPKWVIRSMTSEEVFICREKATAAFPAHAGMNRKRYRRERNSHRVPRTRGDEPQSLIAVYRIG
jgi:hypothetical protein